MVPPHVRLTVNASLVDLLAQVQTGFGYALALLSLTLTWALYSRLRHNPSPHQPAAESARPLARPRSD